MQAGLIQEPLSLQVVHELKGMEKSALHIAILRTLSNIPLDWQCYIEKPILEWVEFEISTTIKSIYFVLCILAIHWIHLLKAFTQQRLNTKFDFIFWQNAFRCSLFVHKHDSIDWPRVKDSRWKIKRERKKPLGTHSEWHTVNKHAVYCGLYTLKYRNDNEHSIYRWITHFLLDKRANIVDNHWAVSIQHTIFVATSYQRMRQRSVSFTCYQQLVGILSLFCHMMVDGSQNHTHRIESLSLFLSLLSVWQVSSYHRSCKHFWKIMRYTP